jgi:hypothetical protein
VTGRAWSACAIVRTIKCIGIRIEYRLLIPTSEKSAEEGNNMRSARCLSLKINQMKSIYQHASLRFTHQQHQWPEGWNPERGPVMES